MSLLIRLHNVYDQPLQDKVDLEVIDSSKQETIVRKRDISVSKGISIKEVKRGVRYKIRAFPRNYRPVACFARFVSMPTSRPKEIKMLCPVHPDRVQEARFPNYDQLDLDLQKLLNQSQVHVGGQQQQGQALYNALGDLQKAGLLNLYAKMKSTPLPSGLPVSHYIESLYRIRGDRVFANVQLPLRDLVKTAQNVGQFDEVSGVLHNPDEEGFHLAGSYKTQDQYGNLQLTFFANTATPPPNSK